MIYTITAQKIVFQYLIGPLAELNTTLGLHTITYGNNHVKIIVFDITSNSSAPFFLNYRKFCDSWKTSQFFLQSIIYMFADCLDIPIKQHCYLIPVQPYGLVLNPYI